MQLTQADRCVLLDSFRKISREWAGDHFTLISDATEWVARLEPSFGFEFGIGRDVFLLCDTLRKAVRSPEAAELARGGLAYLIQSNCREPSPLGSLGLLDDAFIAGYAAHAVREKLGESARYSPPDLSSDEKARAEELFLELLDKSAEQDEDLPGKAREAIGQLKHLLDSGLFRRLRANVHFLIDVLQDPGRSADHRQIARASLHYVVLDNDIIPDNLGLLGFLDDYFVADLAVGLIDSGRPPWLNLIDATVGAWPFLNMVVFEDGQAVARGTPLSEFLMVNTSLVCPAVRESGSGPQPMTHLILPRTGPIPLLLGFLTSLGVLWRSRAGKEHHVPFRPGHKVLIDGKAVRTFDGCQLENGRTLLRLRKTRREHGLTLATIEMMPIEQLHRLSPAGADRSTRGRISNSDGQEKLLGVLDYLFLSSEPVLIPADFPQIVVSSPGRVNKEIAETIQLFGQKLCDAVPMGSLTLAGEISHWSSRFGTSRPTVLVIPDVDRACEYVEESGDRVFLTIVDATGHNAGRTAALARLHGLGSRVLVVSSLADAAESFGEDTNTKIWEWNVEDLSSLVAEPRNNGSADGPVRGYEREVVRALTANVDVIRVHSAGVAEAFQAVTVLKEAVEARDDEPPAALENALDLSFMTLTRLLRCPFQLGDHPRLLSYVVARLDLLAECKAATAFLTSQEIQAIADAEDRLRALSEVLRRRNPKTDALATLRVAAQKITVVCEDNELLDTVDGLTVNSASMVLDLRGCESDTQYAIAGWFGRRAMTRLLRPPFASPLHLILHDSEANWYRLFARRVQKESAARRGRASRSQLFPGVTGWKDPTLEPEAVETRPPDKLGDDPLDAIRTRLILGRRGRLTSLATPSAEDTAVEARLVMFDGGYAFLTDNYQAKLATHLLESTSDKKDAELELVPARRLKRGDIVLFLRGSSRDVIRDVADKLLPPGRRELAGLWRTVLLKYRQEMACTIDVVWQRLHEHGCPLSLDAVRNWFEDEQIIAPLSYKRDVTAVCDLTCDKDLREHLDDCFDAISQVRGAHLQASKLLARRVLDTAVAGLKSSSMGDGTVDLGEGIVLVRVTDVDDTRVKVRTTAANRLVEE